MKVTRFIENIILWGHFFISLCAFIYLITLGHLVIGIVGVVSFNLLVAVIAFEWDDD